MDRSEGRRLRLRQLIDERCNGSITECANLMNKPASYIGRLLYPTDKKGQRNIGDGLITAIEDIFHLPPGWLDGFDQDAELTAITKMWPSLNPYKKAVISGMVAALASLKEPSEYAHQLLAADKSKANVDQLPLLPPPDHVKRGGGSSTTIMPYQLPCIEPSENRRHTVRRNKDRDH